MMTNGSLLDQTIMRKKPRLNMERSTTGASIIKGGQSIQTIHQPYFLDEASQRNIKLNSIMIIQTHLLFALLLQLQNWKLQKIPQHLMMNDFSTRGIVSILICRWLLQHALPFPGVGDILP
jgi:hypothetical protein